MRCRVASLYYEERRKSGTAEGTSGKATVYYLPESDPVAGTAPKVFGQHVALATPLAVEGKKLNLADGDPFESIDILPKRRDEILGRLDHWNQETNVKVDKSFEVLSKSISSQVHYFLDNNADFLKKARPSKIPDNVIGYELLRDKLGLQECRKIILSGLYNDQLFYVQLLRFLIQTGAESDANLREEEQQLRNDHSDKPRMSVAKTSKSRRLRYTVIEKLQNFVVSAFSGLAKSEQERTRKKAVTSPDVVDLIISLPNGLGGGAGTSALERGIMAGIRRHEIFVSNDGHKFGEVVEECSGILTDGSADEVVLKVPLKHATRAVSVCESLKRRFADIKVAIELRNIFVSLPNRRAQIHAEWEIRSGAAPVHAVRDTDFTS
ncbi:TRAUB domain containing protein [Babesia ovata]|uniref:TRAUB domain containing protein n=1 Tax=Babesia ovata TaxID=189622 RepID=A0A2H6KHP6_9APIC|nr:TRAUB domain containing protein [Babesia ovata]GBE62501.1 TRAUB domain containing protein [Babesia ovata]